MTKVRLEMPMHLRSMQRRARAGLEPKSLRRADQLQAKPRLVRDKENSLKNMCNFNVLNTRSQHITTCLQVLRGDYPRSWWPLLVSLGSVHGWFSIFPPPSLFFFTPGLHAASVKDGNRLAGTSFWRPKMILHFSTGVFVGLSPVEKLQTPCLVAWKRIVNHALC